MVGASYDRQNELRRGYNNFDGATLGVKGALRRDENNITYNVDAYTQGTWDFADAWSATLGVRRSEVHFDSEDHFITGTNGDDSGGVTVRRHVTGRGPGVQGSAVDPSLRLVRSGIPDAARL